MSNVVAVIGASNDRRTFGTLRVWLNPGSGSDGLLARARRLSTTPIVARSIMAIGANPCSF
jgi:hypothetical protein